MRALLDALRIFGIFTGCLALALIFERCSPIAPSSNKTLIRSTFSNPGVNPDGSTSIGSAESSPSLRNTPGKTFSVSGKLIDKKAGLDILAQFDEGKTKSAWEPIVLSPVQIKDLRENRHALLHLPFAPSTEMVLYFQVPSLASAPAGVAEKDLSPAVEVQLKAMGGNSWMMTLVTITDLNQQKAKSKSTAETTVERSNESDASASSKMSWLANSLQAVILFPDQWPGGESATSAPSRQE